ncbi:MAG: hypothetical protein HY744_09725 [Deltaproteobacteria bacterium]|nr:hypothetical protein [Deltaproteobacteria bacterium]
MGPHCRRSPTLRRLGRARYWTTALLFMTMLGVVVKIALRLGFGVKYIMAGPMGFNI